MPSKYATYQIQNHCTRHHLCTKMINNIPIIFQLVQNDLASQEPVIKFLNEAVAELIERSPTARSSWREKQGEMNELYDTVCIMSRDKHNRLQDTLKEVCGLFTIVALLHKCILPSKTLYKTAFVFI